MKVGIPVAPVGKLTIILWSVGTSVIESVVFHSDSLKPEHVKDSVPIVSFGSVKS